jgi:O-antigen/teichoic acid export membrane protein
MSVSPARPSPPRPSSPAPSLPTTPGEEGERQEKTAFEAPSLPVWGGGRGRERGGWGSEGSPREGSMEGAGEEGRGGEGRAGDRFRRWAKILSAYFSTQTVVQLTGIAAGLLFVNFMPVREFALYTLAFSVITFFNFITDLGSSTSLVYFFHRTSKEGEAFQPYFAAVLSLRRTAFLLGAAGVLLVFPRMAAAKGYGLTEALLVTGAIVLCVWFQIASSLRVLALRLADRYRASYRAELAGGFARLLLAALLVVSALLKSWLGVLASAVGSAVVAILARPATAAPIPAIDLRRYQRKVLRYLLPTLPSALYFAIQGPLTVWLAATFGVTRNIAEVGALGRLGLLVGIFSSLTGVVFLPRLARITDDRLYRRRVVQFGSSLAAVALTMFAAAALAPDLFLLLLGKNYAGLHRELLLVVAGAGVSLIDGYLVSVNLARAWTRWQGLAVASLVAVQAVLVALLPLSATAGVLTFNLLSGAAAFGGQLAIVTLGFTRPRWVQWK